MDEHLRKLVEVLLDPAFGADENPAQRSVLRQVTAALEQAEARVAELEDILDRAEKEKK